MKSKSLLTAIVSAIAICLIAVGTATAAETIRVQSTTDTVDAGLVDGLLMPMYQAKYPDDTIQYTAVGTGKALDNARNGLGDVVMTHARPLEMLFVADGYSYEPAGRAIFYSDYVIVGPTSDPAGVLSGHPHDAVGAFEDIAAAGEDDEATFLSRGDNSGTNVQEQLMWGMSDVPKKKASNAGLATDRFEPGTGAPGPPYPSWYFKTNKGQAANLLETSACNTGTYPNGNCYTMLDRGSFNRQVNLGTVTNMKIASENNTANVRGGPDLMINAFSLYIVDPVKVPSVNLNGAKRFADFMVSPEFQAAVVDFPNAIDPAFRPDAFPKVTPTAALPGSVPAGTEVAISLKLENRLPGTPAVSGMPVKLQGSVGNGAYQDIGAAQNTGADGVVTFSVKITERTSLRVELGAFQATDWSMFSPNTQSIGTIDVAAAAVPKALDKRAPKVRSVKLSAEALSFRLNEAATVRVTLERRRVIRRGGRRVVRWNSVLTRKLKVKKAGTVKLNKRCRKGTYRVRVQVVDAAGNKRVMKKTVRLAR